VRLSHSQHFSTRLPTVCGSPTRLNSASRELPSSPSSPTVIVPCSVMRAACTFIDPLVLIVCCFSRFGFLVAMVTRLCTGLLLFVCGFSSFLSSSAQLVVLLCMSLLGIKSMLLAANLLLRICRAALLCDATDAACPCVSPIFRQPSNGIKLMFAFLNSFVK
jgi:hypothetical protein